MPSLGELKKRLKSARTIEQLSGAMRSAATAKYLKLSSALSGFAPYSAAIRETSDAVERSGAGSGEKGEKRVFVLLSGNHGLCGGYHQELFRFFTETALEYEKDPMIITCGKKAYDFCSSKGLSVIKSFSVPDVPSYDDAQAVISFLEELFAQSDEAVSVSIVYQKFFNMLKSRPVSEVLKLKASETGVSGSDETLFIPDRASVSSGLFAFALDADMYRKLLSAASAAQAATVVAMRSAYDNAKRSISGLESKINRLRQAAVTASVLETSVGIKEQL